MTVFDSVDFDHHESVTFFNDKASGFKAIIAIHSRALGPALGGARMQPYKTDGDALTDVLRLSRGMSYKNALAGLPLGGGKAVIIADPADKNDALLLALGQAVDSLGGRYITSVDMNMELKDLPTIRRRTEHVVPSESGDDPSPATALGTFAGIKAAIKHKFKTDTAKGLRVALQGAGKVGLPLAIDLAREGATLFVSDPDLGNLRKVVDATGATATDPDKIHAVDCDVFAPCAKGGSINDQTISQLKCKIVAGCANNQLVRDAHGDGLKLRGILYAPDYVINAGGVICVAAELCRWNRDETNRRLHDIGSTLSEIFRRADVEQLPTNIVADRLAKERIAAGAARSAKAAE